MPKAVKGTNQQKYLVDKSTSKYQTRYDRLLNILFHSREIPTDLYEQMNMSFANYKQTIYKLKQKKLIRKIERDRTIGYILTTQGKELTNEEKYKQYKGCVEGDERKYDIKHRSRKRQFARLYALLDRMGIPYEVFAKPKLTRDTVLEDRLYFYTALDIKEMAEESSAKIIGSRAHGFLVGKGRVIAIYSVNRNLNSFSEIEGVLPELLRKHFPVTITTAIMICDDEAARIEISKKIMENGSNSPKVGLNTAKYKQFYVLTAGDEFEEELLDVYDKEKEKYKQELIREYNIQTEPDKEHRQIIGTGVIDGSQVYIATSNIDIVAIRKFTRFVRLNRLEAYVYCQTRDREYVRAITEGANIQTVAI